MFRVKRQDVIVPGPGQYEKVKKEGIERLLSEPEKYFNFFILRADGRLERYFGNSRNKCGYSKITYDPANHTARPGVGKWRFADEW